jgi:hypothetical protein
MAQAPGKWQGLARHRGLVLVLGSVHRIETTRREAEPAKDANRSRVRAPDWA